MQISDQCLSGSVAHQAERCIDLEQEVLGFESEPWEMFRSFSFISHSDGFHVTHKTVKSDQSADFSCGLQREAGLRSTLRHSVIFTQIPVLKSKNAKTLVNFIHSKEDTETWDLRDRWSTTDTLEKRWSDIKSLKYSVHIQCQYYLSATRTSFVMIYDPAMKPTALRNISSCGWVAKLTSFRLHLCDPSGV